MTEAETVAQTAGVGAGGVATAGWGRVRDWPTVSANMRPDLDRRLRRLRTTRGMSRQRAINLCVEAGLPLLEQQAAAPGDDRPMARGRRRAEAGPGRTVREA
jgi:hypothetical protein